jgi:flagellin-like protein
MLKKMRNNKGVSPIVATVLLIAMVVVIALILFLWFRNMVKEEVVKFEEENIEMTCDK